MGQTALFSFFFFFSFPTWHTTQLVFSRRRLCRFNVSLLGRFLTLVCWLVLVFFFFFFHKRLDQSAHVGFSFDILRRRVCHVNFGFIGVNSGMHSMTSTCETWTSFHHRFCIQTYAKGREFCFDFWGFCIIFESIAFLKLFKSSFTAARNDSFPLGKREQNRWRSSRGSFQTDR